MTAGRQEAMKIEKRGQTTREKRRNRGYGSSMTSSRLDPVLGCRLTCWEILPCRLRDARSSADRKGLRGREGEGEGGVNGGGSAAGVAAGYN